MDANQSLLREVHGEGKLKGKLFILVQKILKSVCGFFTVCISHELFASKNSAMERHDLDRELINEIHPTARALLLFIIAPGRQPCEHSSLCLHRYRTDL